MKTYALHIKDILLLAHKQKIASIPTENDDDNSHYFESL